MDILVSLTAFSVFSAADLFSLTEFSRTEIWVVSFSILAWT